MSEINQLAKPLGDRVLIEIKKNKDQKTESGIFIPGTASTDENQYGTVISIGNGLYTQSGISIPMTVEVGDTVLIPAYHQGIDVKLNQKEYLLLRESELLMVIR